MKAIVPWRPRLAGPCEVALLAELHARCFGAAGDEVWDGPAVAALMGTPGTFALLAVEDGDVPVGLAIARTAGGESEILTIGVLPGRRRSGHGIALIDAASRHAVESGAKAVFLEVAADNDSALALYRRGGFRPVGRRTGYYRRAAGNSDAVVLRRDLIPAVKGRLSDRTARGR